MRRTCFISVSLAIALLCATVSRGATLLFTVSLDGLQETPPVLTPASGDGTLSLNDVTGAYTISGNFFNLVGTSNNAHIHGPAAVGVGPAGVIHGLTFDFGVTSGTYSGANVFTAPQMANLIAELYYVNIHSSAHAGGEIRGQITQVPEPGSLVLLGLGGIAIAAAKWRRKRAQ